MKIECKELMLRKSRQTRDRIQNNKNNNKIINAKTTLSETQRVGAICTGN